ncbi:hypothetical protein V5G99_10790 [Bibersteinia trehalosi]|uniref:hypothetical protein n=1 Tax=Bibersteinia trehalosi TaxID=47735 RepID=UPI003D298464
MFGFLLSLKKRLNGISSVSILVTLAPYGAIGKANVQMQAFVPNGARVKAGKTVNIYAEEYLTITMKNEILSSSLGMAS